MSNKNIDAELATVAVTDLLPRETIFRLWKEFEAERPDDVKKMIEYDGSDPDWVQAMSVWISTYVLHKLEGGELPSRSTEKQVFEANAIGGSMIQIAKILHPDIVFRRTDRY